MAKIKHGVSVKEVVKNINVYDGVHAHYESIPRCLYVYDDRAKTNIGNTGFMMFDVKKAISWSDVTIDYTLLSNVQPDVLVFIFRIIGKLLNTPVEERFDERYYIRVITGYPYPDKKYIKSVSIDSEKAVFKLTSNKKEATKYTMKALPSCRFDISFEPVEDDE